MSVTVNKVLLSGVMCRTPRFRFVKGKKRVCDVTVSARGSLIDITCWQEDADLANTLRSGDKVAISGRLVSETYKKDEVTKFKIKVVADSLELISLADEPAKDNAAEEKPAEKEAAKTPSESAA